VKVIEVSAYYRRKCGFELGLSSEVWLYKNAYTSTLEEMVSATITRLPAKKRHEKKNIWILEIEDKALDVTGMGVRMWTGFRWLVAGSYANGNEFPCPVKVELQ
jgi:hypothetical protein